MSESKSSATQSSNRSSKQTEDEDEDVKGEFKSRSILEIVKAFCTSTNFEQDFEAFAKDYAEVFANALSYSYEDEHPLEFHNTYLIYLGHFEKKIEKFIRKEGYEIREFYEECKAILEDDSCAGETRFFVEALLATSEYDTFFMLMKSEIFRMRSEGKDTE